MGHMISLSCCGRLRATVYVRDGLIGGQPRPQQPSCTACRRMPLVFTGVAADAIEAPSRARRRSALPKNAPNSLKLRPCPSRRGQVGFVIGTAIVAISQNPVIEIGVATPHRACIRNFLRSGSSREFVASEASFCRTGCRHERDGEARAFDRKFLSESIGC